MAQAAASYPGDLSPASRESARRRPTLRTPTPRALGTVYGRSDRAQLSADSTWREEARGGHEHQEESRDLGRPAPQLLELRSGLDLRTYPCYSFSSWESHARNELMLQALDLGSGNQAPPRPPFLSCPLPSLALCLPLPRLLAQGVRPRDTCFESAFPSLSPSSPSFSPEVISPLIF